MSERIKCFFIGHKDAPESVYPDLRRAVESHITVHGVTEFIVGRYGNFDALAARAVREAKVRHPGVVLTALLPYHPSEIREELPAGFDGSWYPPGMKTVPRRAAIVQANRCAVNYAGHLIAYMRHPAGNVQVLVEYAKKRIPVTEI